MGKAKRAWSYLPNGGDRRLAGISNVGLSSAQYSTYGYTTTPENFISSISETSDSASGYPSALTQTASYNNLNQLTNLSGQALTFDADGNLLSDGQRNYSWDVENRLVGITYPGQPGKQTAFVYDGLSRRTTITSTPAAGSATTTSYIWCGGTICQARSGSNSPIRSYYAEGEFAPGVPAQSYYYGTDQIHSVRRVFVSASSAPAYVYDPYGRALQNTAALTDFSYGGMFYNVDSGLYLTQYRAYDPIGGRWLSRDPAGEQSDSVANLYPYVAGNPVSLQDSRGLQAEESEPRSPEEENRAIEEETNPNVRGGLDYTPRPPPPPQPPSNACVAAPPGPPASSFGGGLRSPLKAPIGPPRNEPGNLNGVPYSGHAFDQMQNRGIIPSAAEQALQTGVQNPGNTPGTTRFYDPVNNISVVRDNASGTVITVRPGN